MIKVNSSITIKADIQKIWHFLEDFSLGLSCNRFHSNINIEKSYSIDCDQNVVIKHNFGFGDIDMKLNIEESIPPNKLVINEQKINQELNGFNHTSTFEIIKNSNFCYLHYTVIGTFGNKVADLSFSPILKAVTIEELSKIKKLIESSEDNINTFKNKQYNPI
tara:strand:- start:473 stop:961 length:489 start_codon:yes stop_codon:yes gene_type:complete